MNILSLFDGLSCGQIALNKAGISVNNYYASEIEAVSIKVTQHNFPNTIQIGDVTKIDGSNLQNIDLLIGGSPCQTFSNAVTDNKGFDGKSGLFWEYVRLLKEIKPKWFLLENVMMKKEWEDVITDALGVKPIAINSEHFSAQSRPRLYWTNIPLNNPLPSDQSVIRDIMEETVAEKYYYKESYEFHGWEKNVCATLHINGHDILKRVQSPFSKCPTLTAVCGGNQQKKVLDGTRCRKLTPLEYERLQNIPDNYTSIVSDSARYKMIGNGWTTNVIAHIFRQIPIID